MPRRIDYVLRIHIEARLYDVLGLSGATGLGPSDKPINALPLPRQRTHKRSALFRLADLISQPKCNLFKSSAQSHQEIYALVSTPVLRFKSCYASWNDSGVRGVIIKGVTSPFSHSFLLPRISSATSCSCPCTGPRPSPSCSHPFLLITPLIPISYPKFL